MYSLSIHFGTTIIWTFLFKDKERAEVAYFEAINDNNAEARIEDDYGQRASINRENLHGVMLEDMNLLEEAVIQRSLFQARTQAKYNDRAKTDATIRAAMSRQQPSMITPFGNGQFGSG